MLQGKLIKGIKDPKAILAFLLRHKFFRKLSNEKFLKIKFRFRTGKKLNLNNPESFNEKLQWLKIYNKNPLYTKMVDKYEVRSFIKNTIGEKYLNEVYGVYKSYEEINFEKLPNKFVLKPTHTSGDYFMCENKKEINFEKLKKTVNRWLKRDYFWNDREWPYKNVPPRIIAENFLVQKDNNELRDYRFFCFNGEPKFISVDFSITDKNKTRRNLYDLNWNLMNKAISYPRDLNINLNKPEKLDEMIELSKKISDGIPHSRIDFYYIENRIIFGEITFFHQGGYGKILPEAFNYEMGNWITLPKKRVNEK